MENKEGKIRKNRRLNFFTNTINYNNYNFRRVSKKRVSFKLYRLSKLS